MSQNDLVIDNQSFPATRVDISSALQALGSLSSGPTAPLTTYANMLWYDTGTNTLKMRSEANSVWISVGYLDQSSNAFRIFDDTQVVNSSGTQTGIIGDQATALWEAGASTTESLVSPAKVKAAVEALAPDVTSLTSIERLVAGDAIRNQLTQAINSEESFGIGHSFLQIGTIRVKAIQVSGGTASYSITRNRNRVLTVLSSGALSGAVSVDVGVLPGDAVSATVSVSAGQPGGTYTLSLSTDGGNLWPGSTAQLEGNDV